MKTKEFRMSGKWLQSLIARRSFLARLGMGAGVLGATGISSPVAVAQVASDALWRPARHAQDDWYDKIPGQHRFVFDSTTADGMALALRFANNYFTANQNAYGLKDSDLAVVIIARHKSTSFGYTDAIWAKYGKQLSEQAEFTDPKTKEPPKVNVYAAPADGSDQSGAMDALIKKGVHFAVCQMSSRAIAGRIARATGAETDAILNEIGANLIPNARFVPAGIVAVNRAQEKGYSFALAM
jgi:intracellular sulfur oxidation DsrE/DsrF family protein